jgi:hypothetical protein
MHVAWFLGKEQRGEDFLDDSADGWECQTGGAASHALALDVGVRHGRQDDMMLPAGIRPALEMIEPQFGFEFLILLFDRPALVREGHQRAHGGVRRQMHEVVFDALGASRFFLAQQPDVGRELALPPRMGRPV